MHAIYHAQSSVKRFGGGVDDYINIHSFIDSSKFYIPDKRHRLLLHNTWGINLVQEKFGIYFKNSQGVLIPTRLVAEQHVLEDLRHIPTLEKCMKDLPLYNWLGGRISSLTIKVEE